MATAQRRKPLNLSRRAARCPAVISPDHLYRSDELKNRLGWQDAAWRRAVRQGLNISKQGRWHYCKGSDAIAFITGANS
jgi:hypothetical protein